MPQLPQLQVFEELLKTGDEAMRRNELGRAVELLTRAAAMKEGERGSKVLSALCHALEWSGDNAMKEQIAQEAVANGVWDHPSQRPLNFTRGLPSKNFPDPDAFESVSRAVRMLEDKGRSLLPALQQEAITEQHAQVASEGLQNPDLGRWTYSRINLQGWGDPEHPTAYRLLKDVEKHSGVRIISAGVSTIQPGALIRAHCGPTNECWDLHLGLLIPEPDKYELRVDGEGRRWAEGKVLLFDDSYVHEVHHRGTLPRTILDIVIAHPALPPPEPLPPSPAVAFLRRIGRVCGLY